MRGRYQGQKALVIGGSRGLGELTAKVLAAGGADVKISYLQGREDAQRVCAEIGGNCSAFQFDVTSDRAVSPALMDASHVYFFATARIRKENTPEALQAYCDVYVKAFEQLVKRLAASVKPIHVFYPSSVFVSERPSGFEAYSSAKEEGEHKCAELHDLYPQHTYYRTTITAAADGSDQCAHGALFACRLAGN